MRKQSFQRAKGMFSPRMTWMSLVAALMLCAQVLAQSKESAMAQHASYRTVKIDGLSIFYREVGPNDAPTILLLHGLPSSSRMFEPLLARLGNQFHLVAPDYPGFGHSDAPTPKEFAYTFDNIAAIMDRFTEALHLSKYTLYMQDYGGPVGFRMALAHPDRIEALIVQDAVAHNGGLGANWAPRRAFWADRATHEAALRTNLLSLQTTRTRHLGSDPNPDKYDPDLWTDEFAFLSRPGEADIQSDLFYDYRTNVDAYPKWQAWMHKTQPRLLVLWGKYDLSFDLSEPQAYRRDVPTAQVHILDAGHFALDTAADEITDLIRRFMVVPPASGPAPRIVIDPPLPESLAHGRVIIKYRAENLRISPFFGAPAVGLWPPIGHIHVTVDDAPWRWADSSGEPLVLNGFPAGPHKVLIELVDSNHQPLDKGVVTFAIPLPTAPNAPHR